MTHKMAAAEAPPPPAKPHQSEESLKDSHQEDVRKNEPEPKTEEFGYVITNQRYDLRDG